MSFDRLAAALDQGVENGVLADASMVRGIEVATARTWLFLLGYLDRDNGKKVPDDQLLAAQNRFCAEAGLAQHAGDSGPQFVHAMARFLAFDPREYTEATRDTGAANRFGEVGPDSPLMLRAIHVRLYALDLVEELPGGKSDRSKVEKGLNDLADIYALLGLGPLDPGLTTATVEALFDHHRVIERLRQEPHSLTLAHKANSTTKQRRQGKELVKRYVNAIGRIELWLIGYLSRPRAKMWATDTSNHSLPAAMRAFWRDQPESTRPSRQHIEDLTGFFFDRVRWVTEGTADDDSTQDEALRQTLIEDPALARTVRRETESLGARLLDGVRRVARFIVGWIRRRLGGLIALARNIASVLANRVRSVFAVVRDIVHSVGDSWRFLTAKPLPGSDHRALVMIHDGDFDFLLLVNPGARPELVTRIARGIAAMARLFSHTTRFVSHLVSTFIGIARVAGLGGWFGALLAMLSFRQRLEEMRDLLRRIREQRELIEAGGGAAMASA
jgi:hypothetical protein